MLVVGGKEVETGTVSYRDRIDGDQGSMSLDEAIRRLRAEVDARTIRQVVAAPGGARGGDGREAHLLTAEAVRG